eukprot:scaffold25933_cov33-Prasinocladus_malaysianus.AAC.1
MAFWQPQLPRVIWSSCRWLLALARSGQLKLMKWARANGCPWVYEDTINAAINSGHIPVQ